LFEDLWVQIILGDDELIEGNRGRTNTRIWSVQYTIYTCLQYM